MNTPLLQWHDANLLHAEETEIRSQHTGRRYRIQTACIGQPPPQGYPVCSLLDGDAFFPAALSMAQSLMMNPMTRSSTSCLLVGIGYPNGEVRDLNLRALDYTPPLAGHDRQADGGRHGEGDKFARFLDGELMPALENIRPINRSEQAVFGHSFGALFGLYSLFSAPQRFKHYLLVSPSIWWHNRRVLDWMPSEIAADRKLRVSVGEYEGLGVRPEKMEREMLKQAQQLTATLGGLGADVGFTVYPQAHHGNVPFYALPDCIEYLRRAWQPLSA